MKICSKCKQSLPETEFWRDSTQRDGLCIYCKTCKTIVKGKHRWGTFPKANQRLIRERKAAGCIICGYNNSDVALDFHHIDPATK